MRRGPDAYLYALAIIGAALAKTGDLMGTLSVRRGAGWGWLDVIGMVAWAACFPVWRAMSARTDGGLTQPAAAWDVASCGMWFCLMATFGERESPAKSILFVVGVVALCARELVE